MIKRIKQWFTRSPQLQEQQDTYTRQQVIEIVAEAKQVAYNDGKRDGLSIAREQAANSLKEIIWRQNKQK